MSTRHRSLLASTMLVAALAACSSGAGTSPPSSPAETTSSEPSTTPRAQDIMELPEFAPLDPGTYFIDPDLDPSTPLRVTYEVPSEGWAQWTGAVKWDDAAKRLDAVAITTVTNLVRDGAWTIRTPSHRSGRAWTTSLPGWLGWLRSG